jgi:hypothetical protein
LSLSCVKFIQSTHANPIPFTIRFNITVWRQETTWKTSVQMGRRGLNSSGSGQGQMPGCCERSNELSGSIKCGKILDQLRNY